MPSRPEEIHHAEEEGIRLNLLKAPTRIIGDESGLVTSMELVQMELGEPDDSGRRRPFPLQGSEHILEVDTVIAAIGQEPNPVIFSTTRGLDLDKRGYLIVDRETMATTREGVYAGGDIAGLGATVIRAMGDGRLAARAMHEYIMSKKVSNRVH